MYVMHQLQTLKHFWVYVNIQNQAHKGQKLSLNWIYGNLNKAAAQTEKQQIW